MSLPTPEWITMTNYNISKGWIEKILPSGSFVKPISIEHLPQHIKETADFKWYEPTKEVFVYCHYGIILLPRDLIRRIT